MSYANAGYNPYANLLGPAKRAGVLQIVLGSLGALMGLCVGILFAAAFHEMLKQPGMALPPGVDPETVQTVFVAVGFAIAGFSILLLILGVFVLKGGKGAAITSIVLAILATLYFAFNTVVVLGQGNPVGVMLSLGLLGAFVWLTAWLFQAVGAINQNQAAQAQAAQYYQYYQQQQAAGQAPPSQQPQAWGQPGQAPQQQWPGQQGQWPGQRG
ncbi:MAG TPA: hypothetical protein VEA69_13050 [Tepidisphaeraceae bacterium]|nr:hypothetical protein [Tepidisphaeraceae bacterium]